MIRRFKDKRTEAVFVGKMPKGFPSSIAERARRKLRMLDAAVDLDDLSSPPGNRLERLADDRAGQHSIRINDQCGFASFELTATSSMLKSAIITDGPISYVAIKIICWKETPGTLLRL